MQNHVLKAYFYGENIQVFKTRHKWYRIGSSEEELRGSISENGMKVMQVGRYSVLFILHDNELFAIKDRCPHQGAKLSGGACTRDGYIVCPWHKFGFDLRTGRGAGLYVDKYLLQQREEGFCLGVEYFSWFGE